MLDTKNVYSKSMDNQHVKSLQCFASSECSKLKHFIEFEWFSFSSFTVDCR